MNTENHYQETDLGNIAPNPRGEYSPEESYEYLDLVVFEGGSYICLTDTAITGISPESGKTTQYWQVITIPGDLTPEYIAMHDRVVNLSEQVGADAEEVRTAEQNVSGMELNVTQMQEQTRQAAESAEQSKDSAAGYAASADASRRAAEESEQNINAQVTGFDSHVAEKTSEAESNIEAVRIAANAAVVAQQKESIQEVKDQTALYISEKQRAAEQAIEKKAEEYATSVDADIQAVKDAGNAQIQNVNSAGNTQVGNVNSAGATQISAIESAGTAQKEEVNLAGSTQVQEVKDEGATQVANVQAAAEEITGKVAQIDQNTQGISELKGDISNKLDKYDLSINRCDMNARVSGYSLNQNTGELYKVGGWYVSDYCDILTGNDSGVVTVFVKNTLSNLPKYAFYDSNKQYISGSNSYTNPLEVPTNAKYIRIAYNTIDNDFIVNVGDTGVSNAYAYPYYKNEIIVPTKTSQLENDSYYVTSDDVVSKYTLDISINRLNPETTSTGNLNPSTGEITESWIKISDYCDIETMNDTGLVTLYQNEGIKRNFQKVCFYDKDKKFVKGFTEYTNPVAIPSGAKYVIVQTNITTDPWIRAVVNIGDYNRYNTYHWDNLYYRNLSSYVNDVGYSINQWKGKTWSAYGDSITAISNGNGLQLGWAKYVNDVFGFSTFYGRGIGGQRYAWGNAGGSVSFIKADGTYNSRNDSYNKDNYTGDVPEGTTACRSSFCSWDRITHMYPESIKDTIDLIFIMGGTNDSKDETAPVFIKDDVTDAEWASSEYYATYGGDYNISTLKGGMASCIMKMQAWMPQAVIVVGTPLSGEGTEGVVGTSLGTWQYTKSEYIKEVAKMCSIPLIDVYATCGINPWNRTKYISDTVHPYHEDGKKMLARAVIGGLMTIYPMIN